MAVFRIRGGEPLQGRIRASGRKNAAVAVIPAALLARGSSVLENLPDIGDVRTYMEILQTMGARVEELDSHTLRITTNGLDTAQTPHQLVKRMRASYYLLGVLLARSGHAEIALPGGCDIGLRPIDQHIKGFEALGAEVRIEHGIIKAKADRLVGASIYLDVVSVGATMNIMLAASRAEGTTVIENAAKEPHIVDLANFINAMGGRVVGAGTDVIKVRGTKELKGANHAIIPDEIEAATIMMATVGTRGDVTLENVIPKHLEPVSAKLREAGAEVVEDGDIVRVRMNQRPNAINVKTLPYPGFPTDAQQPMTVLLSVADGTSMVTETIWEGRFKHVDELKRMGTNIRVDGRTAIIEGVEKLMGASVHATDLRAGAGLVVAGLMAEGETVVSGIEHIERGYDDTEVKYRLLGANIAKVEEPAVVSRELR